jgi:hypothetical protein
MTISFPYFSSAIPKSFKIVDPTGVATLYLTVLDNNIETVKKQLLEEITLRILADNNHLTRIITLESRISSGESAISDLSDTKYDKAGGIVSGNIIVPNGKIITGNQFSKYTALNSNGYIQISDGENIMVITPTKIEVSGPDENSNVDLTPAVALFNVITGNILQLRSEYSSMDLPSLTINGQPVLAGENPIKIGRDAGQNNQNTSAIAIGFEAGQNTQGSGSISIGFKTGKTQQGENAIAIGNESGAYQGENAIAIGYLAGSQQANNSIVISAKGTVVTASTENATYIAPIRPYSQTNILGYNTNTHEITYFSSPTVGSTASFSVNTTLFFITGNFWEIIKFNNVNMGNTGITYDMSTGEFSLPVGTWQISWSLQWGNGGSNPRWFGIQTGSNIVPGADGQTLIAASNTNGNVWANGSHVFKLNTTTIGRFWTSGGQNNSISMSDKPTEYIPVMITKLQ